MRLLRMIFGRKLPAPVQIASTEVVAAAPLPLATAFKVKVEREERPRFRRSYERQLDARTSIKLEARTMMMSGGRDWSGELTQQDGRWVYFDPDRVADKILDPALVPLVEAACAEAMQLDRDFIRSKPAEFVDAGGTTWRRLA